MAMRSPRYCAEPQPVLRVHHAAARRRGGRRRFEHLDLAGLGVDPADVPQTEVGEEHVVFASPGSRRRCCAAPWRSLNGSQVSILPVARSSRCTPAKPLFCAQTLPSTCELCGLTMLTCAASMFCSGGNGQYVNFLGLAVELDDRGLVHVAEPQIAGRSVRSAERSGRVAGLVLGDRIFGDLAGLGIESAEELLAEARIPGDAVSIDDDVVRLDGVARQIVFGVDDAGGAAARPWKWIEVEAPLLL